MGRRFQNLWTLRDDHERHHLRQLSHVQGAVAHASRCQSISGSVQHENSASLTLSLVTRVTFGFMIRSNALEVASLQRCSAFVFSTRTSQQNNQLSSSVNGIPAERPSCSNCRMTGIAEVSTEGEASSKFPECRPHDNSHFIEGCKR